MGLSAFNAARARRKKEEAEKAKNSISSPKNVEKAPSKIAAGEYSPDKTSKTSKTPAAPGATVEQQVKKKTDAEKLKKKKG